VGLDDPAGDEEPQTGAGDGAGPLQPDERLEDLPGLFGSQPDPLIAHLDLDAVVVGADPEADRSPLGRVFDGVAQQVAQDLGQAVGVPETFQSGRRLNHDLVAGGGGLLLLGDPVDQGDQVHRSGSDAEASGPEAGGVQEIGEQPLHRLAGLEQPGQGGLALDGWEGGPAPEQLGVAQDSGQRRAQVVGHRAEEKFEPPAGGEQVLDLLLEGSAVPGQLESGAQQGGQGGEGWAGRGLRRRGRPAEGQNADERLVGWERQTEERLEPLSLGDLGVQREGLSEGGQGGPLGLSGADGFGLEPRGGQRDLRGRRGLAELVDEEDQSGAAGVHQPEPQHPVGSQQAGGGRGRLLAGLDRRLGGPGVGRAVGGRWRGSGRRLTLVCAGGHCLGASTSSGTPRRMPRSPVRGRPTFSP
jgi:hypothetical protein